MPNYALRGKCTVQFELLPCPPRAYPEVFVIFLFPDGLFLIPGHPEGDIFLRAIAGFQYNSKTRRFQNVCKRFPEFIERSIICVCS